MQTFESYYRNLARKKLKPMLDKEKQRYEAQSRHFAKQQEMLIKRRSTSHKFLTVLDQFAAVNSR